MDIKQAAQKVVEEFSLYDDWMDKYNYLIELGKSLPLIDEKYKDEQHLISGCQSRVWLHAELKDGKVVYTADSDAVITKGIINLLIRVFSNQPPEAIADADLSFIDEIGLKEHLSPTRSNGLVSMIKQMKLYAVVFKTKMQAEQAQNENELKR
ncbi:MAG: SufE family protein [Bacteroidales bacterium]